MEAAYKKQFTLPASAFVHPSLSVGAPFKSPRPEQGYTKVFASFAGGHPDFQVHTEHLRDENTLRFNHQRHFAADIPNVQGKKLECIFCHQPDATRAYYEKPSYEANCKICHSLQFDPRNPSLLVPHASPAAVRAFLRSLPAQYADYARREKGILQQQDLDDFVFKQVTALRQAMVSEQSLEAKVFLSTQRWAPGEDTARLGPGSKPVFYGCAFCHEVKDAGDQPPLVTPPLIPDRWFVRGRFNHAKHTSLECRECHDAEGSSKTSDILLPHQALCITCHSPHGGVTFTCTLCHTFHRILK